MAISANIAQTISNGQAPTINVQTDPSNLAAMQASTANYLATRNALLNASSSPSAKIQNSTNAQAINGTVFPSDIGKYMIKLQINQYTRANITDGASLSAGNVIYLPIPANLIDSQSLKWSEDSLGTGVGALYNASKDATGLGQGLSNLAQNMNSVSKTGDFAGAIGLSAAQAVGRSNRKCWHSIESFNRADS